MTLLGEERAVAAVPMRHRHAVGEPRRLAQIAPERVVVLPRESNRGFYDAVVASCREAGLAPTFVEMPDAHVERALLAVAAGAGMALLPESVADRYAAPGVRFVSLEGDQPRVAVAALTRRDSSNLPTAAFLRELSRAQRVGGLAAWADRCGECGVTSSRPAPPPRPFLRRSTLVKSQIAAAVGCSQMHVSRILAASVEALRTHAVAAP